MMGKRAHSVVVKMETLTICMNPAYAAVMKDNAPDLSQRVQRLQKCHFVVLSYVIVHDDNSKI